jgi:hypothetical protein
MWWDCGASEDALEGSGASNTVLEEGLLALLVKAGYSLTSDTLLEKSLDVGDDLEVFRLTFAGDLEVLAAFADVLMSVGDGLEAVACVGDDFCERLSAASSSAMRFLSSVAECGCMKFWYGSGSGGSIPLTNGSGSCYFTSVTFKTSTKNYFFAYYFLKVHLHHFSKIKSHTEAKKTVSIDVFLTFLLDNRRIRIRNREAQNHPDPQHCS